MPEPVCDRLHAPGDVVCIPLDRSFECGISFVIAQHTSSDIPAEQPRRSETCMVSIAWHAGINYLDGGVHRLLAILLAAIGGHGVSRCYQGRLWLWEGRHRWYREQGRQGVAVEVGVPADVTEPGNVL